MNTTTFPCKMIPSPQPLIEPRKQCHTVKPLNQRQIQPSTYLMWAKWKYTQQRSNLLKQ